MRAQRERAFLRVRREPRDPVAVEQRAGDGGVEEDLHARLAQQVVGRLAPDQRIVHARVGLAVAHRRGEAAAALEEPDELVREAEDDLLGRRVRTAARGVQAAHRSGQAGHGAAAAEAVALDQRDLQPAPRGGHRRRDARRAAARDEDVGVDPQPGAPIDRARHAPPQRACRITAGSHVTVAGNAIVIASVRHCSAMNGITPRYMCPIVISGGATARR